MQFVTPAWDLALFQLINDGRTAAFDVIMPLLSRGPALWLLAGGAASLLYRRGGATRTVFLAILLALSVGISDLSCNILKKSVGRARPLNTLALSWFEEDGRMQQRPADYHPVPEPGTSFPSAHAANAMAAALAFTPFLKRRRAATLLLPLAVGYSRVYLGKHYPTDVLAGYLTGTAAYIAAWYAACRIHDVCLDKGILKGPRT